MCGSIAGSMPWPVSLTVTPPQSVLDAPADAITLQVVATFPGGGIRDVTRPVAVQRNMPEWRPTAVEAMMDFRGSIELLVGASVMLGGLGFIGWEWRRRRLSRRA